MKNVFWCSIIAIIFSNCAIKKNTSLSFKSDNLQIIEVSRNIFVHVSYLQTNDFGKVACNGMVYFNKNEAIVFDTPADDTSSVELINWIQQEKNKSIKAVVVTHFHKDCLGGIAEFHKRGILSISSNKTIEFLKMGEQNQLPAIGFDNSKQIKIGDEIVSLLFFGEGHTKDNIVGYIPKESALFGGCLIKSAGASKGYLGDANTSEWPKTVQKIKTQLPDLKIIIPGHGKYGGIELLDYTIQLFKE